MPVNNDTHYSPVMTPSTAGDHVAPFGIVRAEANAEEFKARDDQGREGGIDRCEGKQRTHAVRQQVFERDAPGTVTDQPRGFRKLPVPPRSEFRHAQAAG